MMRVSLPAAGIVVGLEERCGNGVANLAFDHAAHNLCLLLSPCGDKHLAGSQDVGDTQGDRAWRHRLLRAEAQRHLLAADGVDEDEAGLRSEGRTGLVGSDVTHTAYAEQHHVDAAKGLDALLIEAALALHVFLGDGTVEGIDILLGNVDVAQQTLAELADGAVLAVGSEGEKLIGVEDNHVLEADELLLVAVYQLVEYGGQRLASTHTYDTILAEQFLGLDFGHDGIGYLLRTFIHRGIDVGEDVFVACNLGALYGRLGVIKLFGNCVEYNLRT